MNKMCESSKSDKARPIMGQKPAIPSKPKFIPPVNVKCQKVIQKQHHQQRDSAEFSMRQQQPLLSKNSSGNVNEYCAKSADGGARDCYPCAKTCTKKSDLSAEVLRYYGSTLLALDAQNGADPMKQAVDDTKCDKRFTTINDSLRKYDDKLLPQKLTAPNSPSTVCCSILSNASADCCGIVPSATNKKELNGKMVKVESVDSNSSDSGGFKDFVQLDVVKIVPPPPPPPAVLLSHQRNVSQPEFLMDNTLSYASPKYQNYSHQRKTSQPDYFAGGKTHFTIANAQALAHFLPHQFTDSDIHRQIPKGNVAQTSQLFLDKAEELRTKSTMAVSSKPAVISHGQFQASTKKLEELLSQRIEREKVAQRRGQSSCLTDGEATSQQDVEQKMMVQKQIQQKLKADLQQTVKHIQEIQSIEYRLPQNRKWSEVCEQFIL